MTRTLERLGYRVRVAETGRQALALWPQVAADVDLLFADVVMPEGISGWELAQRLRALKPDLKVVVTSGHNAEAVAAELQSQPGVVFLPKPCAFQKLGVVLRSCLAGEPTAPPSAPVPAPPPPLTRAMVAVVPAELAKEIAISALRGRYGYLLELLEQVTALDAQLGPRLQALVKQFDWATLQELFAAEESGERVSG